MVSFILYYLRSSTKSSAFFFDHRGVYRQAKLLSWRTFQIIFFAASANWSFLSVEIFFKYMLPKSFVPIICLLWRYIITFAYVYYRPEILGRSWLAIGTPFLSRWHQLLMSVETTHICWPKWRRVWTRRWIRWVTVGYSLSIEIFRAF